MTLPAMEKTTTLSYPETGVVITTYNQPEWLKKVLWGFEVQTQKDFEILVADDGSAYETREVIDWFSKNSSLKIKHIWHPDEGFQKCAILNKAIVRSESDYLIFTDGDCIPRKDFVEAHLKRAQKGFFLSGGYLKLSLKVSKVISREDIIQQRPFSRKWLKQQGQPFSQKLIKLVKNPYVAGLLNFLTPTRATWNGHNVSGWKKDILAVNGYNEDMTYGGLDRELGERLMNFGIKGKQIRYYAICLHLDHPRPYKTPESMEKNKAIRKRVRREKITRVLNGIEKAK